MAGTSDNYRQSDILLGAGRLYGSVGVPANNARLAIDATTLTPDSTSGAVHLGGTKAGAKLTISESWDEYFIDEFPDPIITNLSQSGVTLEAELAGVLDLELLALLTPGSGTYAAGSGYEQLTGGRKAIAYMGVCVVAPRADDSTKIVVAHIYKAINTAGVSLNFGRKEQGFTPVNFKGYAITTRDADDTLYNVWHTVAV
jgi:hypothetical protein